MFEEHNKLTTATFSLFAISSLVGLVVIAICLPQFMSGQIKSGPMLAVISSLMVIVNACFAYLVYKRSLTALKLSKWLYAVQIFGIETETWIFTLSFGTNVSMRMGFGLFAITINLLAIVILFVVVRAYRSANVSVSDNQLQVHAQTQGRT